MSARAALAALAAVAITASASAQVEFDTGRAFPATRGPCVALADVDEDGRLDVIASGGPGLLVHSVPEPFAPHVPPYEWPLVGTPTALSASDVDGDGHVDIAVVAVSGGTSRLGFFFGDGSGGATFRVAVIVDVGSSVLIDSDGDPFLDIVAARPSAQTIVLLRQDPQAPRAFLSPTPAPAGGKRFALAPGDFDGDGAADVVAFGADPTQLLLLGTDGAGSFTRSRSFPIDNGAAALVAGDYDRDGLDDVVATDGRKSLFSLRGDRAAGLVAGWTGPREFFVNALAAGDLDGDGNLDFVSAADQIKTWFGDGAASFVLGTSIVDVRVNGALAIGDVDGDGVADIVGPQPLGDGVDLLLRRASGEYLLPSPLEGSMTGSGAAADLNLDGTVDLAFSGAIGLAFGNGRLYVFFGDGSGGLSARGEAQLRRKPKQLLVADVVGGPAPDIVLSNTSSNGFTVLRNDAPAGGFVDLGDFPAPERIAGSAIGDFDGDGAADVASGDEGHSSFSVAFGNGAGLFVPTTVPAPMPQSAIAAGDLDADGFADVVLATISISSRGVTALFGAANRTFVAGAPMDVGPEPTGLAVADVDRDGILDILVCDERQSVVRVLFGDGARGISRTLSVATPMPANSPSLGDATGDGVDDLLAAHGAAHAFSVAPGDGRGGFLSAMGPFRSLWGASQVFATDLGEDGVREVVVTGNDGPASLCRPRESALAVAMRGTVDSARGRARDVLFVNGRTGGSSRTVSLGATDPLSIAVVRPPVVAGLAPFAMYAWPTVPTTSSPRSLPRGLGSIALPMPLAPGSPGPAPSAIWNNVGKTGALGVATRPSSPAPTTLFSAPSGSGRAITFTLQGLIVDPGAPNGRAAVTNGVVVEIR